MAEEREQSELAGILFPTREKRSERSPDLRGKATVGGRRYRLSAWRKTDRSGGEFFSLAFTVDAEQARV